MFLENEEFEFIQMVTTGTDCDDIDSTNEVSSERQAKCEENILGKHFIKDNFKIKSLFSNWIYICLESCENTKPTTVLVQDETSLKHVTDSSVSVVNKLIEQTKVSLITK